MNKASTRRFGRNGILANQLILRERVHLILDHPGDVGVDPFEQEDGDMHLLRALAEARRRELPDPLRESIDIVLDIHVSNVFSGLFSLWFLQAHIKKSITPFEVARHQETMYVAGLGWVHRHLPLTYTTKLPLLKFWRIASYYRSPVPYGAAPRPNKTDSAHENSPIATPSFGTIVGTTVASIYSLSLLAFAVLCFLRVRHRRR